MPNESTNNAQRGNDVRNELNKLFGNTQSTISNNSHNTNKISRLFTKKAQNTHKNNNKPKPSKILFGDELSSVLKNRRNKVAGEEKVTESQARPHPIIDFHYLDDETSGTEKTASRPNTWSGMPDELQNLVNQTLSRRRSSIALDDDSTDESEADQTKKTMTDNSIKTLSKGTESQGNTSFNEELAEKLQNRSKAIEEETIVKEANTHTDINHDFFSNKDDQNRADHASWRAIADKLSTNTDKRPTPFDTSTKPDLSETATDNECAPKPNQAPREQYQATDDQHRRGWWSLLTFGLFSSKHKQSGENQRSQADNQAVCEQKIQLNSEDQTGYEQQSNDDRQDSWLSFVGMGPSSR